MKQSGFLTGEIEGVRQQSHILGLFPEVNLSLPQMETWSSPAQVSQQGGRKEFGTRVGV